MASIETNAGKMEASVEKMDAQLKLWAAKIDDLSAKAEIAGEQAKAGYRQRIDELKAKRAMVQAKYDEFKASGSEKWQVLRAGLESAWSELESAFKEMTR